MTLPRGLLLFGAALVAGILNSVAGGGSFFTFPTLILTGVPSVQANATNTVALWPGIVASIAGYRKELAGRRDLLVLVVISLVGGTLGAYLLLHTPQSTFTRLIPFLLLFATLLFAFGGRIALALRNRMGKSRASSRAVAVIVAFVQFVIAVYGGYFGGGIGILMLASLALMGMENMHRMNAVKTVLAACINGVAVVTFIVARAVFWPQAIVMTLGAIVGGYGGATLARKLPPAWVRRFVIAVGLGMSVLFFINPKV
ncbi:MAG TPA: sulfite exporter TauE/SafE family protein [Ktedonobacterales bacterium]|nr:sulfite exporter TauE/SafE family protein [Ktedonobacterales bacterium]